MHGKGAAAYGLALAAVLAAGCGGGSPRDEWAGLVRPDVLKTADLAYYWHATTPLNPGEQVVRLYRLDENLYLVTDQNRVFVRHAGTGALRWFEQIASPSETVFAPVHASDVSFPEQLVGVAGMTAAQKPLAEKPYDIVLFNTLTQLRVFRRDSGKEIRNVELQPPAAAGAAADTEHAYIGSANGLYYAIRLAEAVKIWTLSVDGSIVIPPACFEQMIYAGSDNGTFNAARQGIPATRVWTQNVGSPVTAPFFVDSRGCFVGSNDGRVHAYDGWKGTELWREPFVGKGPIYAPVVAGANSLFVYVERDALYALDVATGRVRWSMPEGRRVLNIVGGSVYVLDRDNNLRVVDEMLGKAKTALPMTGLDVFARSTGQAGVYAATRDGRVFCIRPVGAPYLSEDILRGRS